MTSSTESDKIDLILQVDAECGVLIETLWNVNMTSEIPGIKKMEY